ncbi:hypothetical protein [Photobacterium leiognathi]|uniref:hypothetical protein n=1 Tax=Photobacterium leiognathi TaxID=553611 RepID=UPI00273496DA|nr:hypothetical protein [Photobacterium leiognathi]
MDFEKSDKIIVTSNDYLKHSEQLELFNEKCEVIPIGIDTSEQLVNHELVLKIKQKYDNKCIVFSLGRHIYYKGFEYLLNAAKNTEGAVS